MRERQREGERGGLGERENEEEEGRVKTTGFAADLPSPQQRRQGRGNYPVHEDNLIQLSQHRPGKGAIYGSFLLANSLYTKRKKSNTCTRWGERGRQEKISLPGNHVWGCGMALSVLFPGHSEAPTVLIIPIT